MWHRKAWQDFWSNQFHSVAWTVCLCGLSFVKVIQIRQKRLTDMASLWVFGHSQEMRGASSCLLCISEAQLGLCKSGRSKLVEVVAGSRSVRAQRSAGGGSAPSPPHPAPTAGAATVIAGNYLCNMWCFRGSAVFVCPPWLISHQYSQYFTLFLFFFFSVLSIYLFILFSNQLNIFCHHTHFCHCESLKKLITRK